MKKWHRAVFAALMILLAGFPAARGEAPREETLPVAATAAENTQEMLGHVLDLTQSLQQRIRERKQELQEDPAESRKAQIQGELLRLNETLAEARKDFERIATGVDVDVFSEAKAEVFNWQDELLSLAEPGIRELKRLTLKARQKTRLKDELAYYEALLPVARQALENLGRLIEATGEEPLKSQLEKLVPEWQGQLQQLESRRRIARMNLEEMASEEQSLIETSRISIKNFFKTRGLYLFTALMACAAMILGMRFAYLYAIRFVPGFQKPYRPFHLRVMDLVFRSMTGVLTLGVLLLVFYLFEDWVLLSVTIIFLMGLIWAAKHTVPKFINQSQLMLNIGTVREGERMTLDGIPWLVRRINMFSLLENPDLNLTLRVPIETLMDQRSRPFAAHEPWFPCRLGEWVILKDGTRGEVTSLSHEMVELTQRGGAIKTCQTKDFLSLSPLNLSRNFRIKVPFGISYSLQARATADIPRILDEWIRKQMAAEAFGTFMTGMKVEFSRAGDSSLDLEVIADFSGDAAPLYNRIIRCIQKWCTDACTRNDWEIPFPQITVHQA